MGPKPDFACCRQKSNNIDSIDRKMIFGKKLLKKNLTNQFKVGLEIGV